LAFEAGVNTPAHIRFIGMAGMLPGRQRVPEAAGKPAPVGMLRTAAAAPRGGRRPGWCGPGMDQRTSRRRNGGALPGSA